MALTKIEEALRPAMSQANFPTFKEFIAAWNEGLIDTTQEGVRIILETVYNRYVSK